MTIDNSCPCQSGNTYENCCQPYHAGETIPQTAELLMRSRYCAYAQGKLDYLIQTTHRENRQYRKNVKAWREEIRKFCMATKFLGLKIIEAPPSEDGQNAIVVFEAELSQSGSKQWTMHEKSYFVKLGQRWLYHSAE